MNKNGITWFSVIGTGNVIFVSTQESGYDTILNVFKGSCFDLECVMWNDDTIDSLHSEVFFCAEAGVTHLIGVGGYDSNVGDFELFVLDYGPCFQSPSCSDVAFNIDPYYDFYYVYYDYDGRLYYDGYGFYTAGDTRILDQASLPSLSCNKLVNGFQNAWFSYTGNNRIIEVDTCDSCYDTILTIYEAMDGCDEFRCVDTNDDHTGQCFRNTFGECTVNTFSSYVEFCAASTSQYYIVVSGYYGDTGAFKLTLIEGEPCVYNSICKYAKPVVYDQLETIDTQIGYDDETYVTRCNYVYDGVNSAWFMLEGTGGLIQITDFTEYSYQYLSVTVWTSDSNICNVKPDLCLEGSYLYGDVVEFCTKPNQMYWISIGGSIDEGQFTVEFTKTGGCRDVENQSCDHRDLVDISRSDKVIRGTTEYAGGKYGSFSCGGVVFNSPGYVWYSVIGNGKEITASLCNSNTDFDTVLAVIESSCTYVTCVAANDDGCDSGYASALSFCGFKDIEYYILVGGYSSSNQGYVDSGNYQLLLRENSFCDGTSVCEASIPMNDLPYFVQESTSRFASNVDAILYNVPLQSECIDGGSDFITTQWYALQSEFPYMIDLTIFSSFHVVVGIFKTNCQYETTTCYNYFEQTFENDYQTYYDNYDVVEYYSTFFYQTYSICGAYTEPIYIMIGGDNDQRGEYTLYLDYSDLGCTIAESVTECSEANEILSMPHNIYGDTTHTTTFFDAQCIGDFYSFGNDENIFVIGHTWFTVDGNADLITISACENGNNNSIKFSVFEDCDSNECITYSSTDSCELTWCGVPGITYYIKMGSLNTNPYRDEYILRITESDTCVAPPLEMFVVPSDKTKTSITFAWNEPESYGYPILSYTYALEDSSNNVIYSDTIPSQVRSLTLNDLQENTNYYLTIYATNQWGDGFVSYFEESTLDGDCHTYPVDIITDTTNIISENRFYGNFLTPSKTSIIHSIEIYVGVPEYSDYYDYGYDYDYYSLNYDFYYSNYYSSVEFIALYESQSLENYFELVEFKEFKNGPIYDGKVLFDSLEWNICLSKKYFIAYSFAGVYQSLDESKITTCMGDFEGGKIHATEFYFVDFEIPEHVFWDNPILKSNLFQMRIDSDIISQDNIPPSAPQILTVYSSVTSITMTFRESCSNSPIISYDAYIEPVDGGKHISSNRAEEFYFSGLSPDTEYTITLTATNQFGESEQTVTTLSTLKSRYSLQWLSQSGSESSSSDVQPRSVCIDSNGNVISAGFFTDLLTFGDSLKIEAQKFVYDGYVIKLDTNGIPVWLNHITGGIFGDVYVTDVAVDAQGDVYVVGTFKSNIQFSPDTEPIFTTYPSSFNAFIVKYASNNGALLWYKHFGDIEGYTHEALAVTIDKSNNNVILGGYIDGFANEVEFYEDEYTLLGAIYTNGYYPYYCGIVVIWKPNGELYNIKSIIPDVTQANESDLILRDVIFVTELDTDTQGNIYVTGTMTNYNYDDGILSMDDSFYLPINGATDVWLSRLDSDLNTQWLIGLGSATQDDYNFNSAQDISVHEDHKLVVVGGYFNTNPFGYYPSTAEKETLGEFTLLTELSYGNLLVGIDIDSGDPLWFNPLSENLVRSSGIYGVTITDSGEVISTGYYQGLFIFGQDFTGIPFPKTEYNTAFFASVDLSGELLWSRWAGNVYDYQGGWDIESFEDVVVSTGYFRGSASFDCEKTTTATDYETYIVKLIDSTIDFESPFEEEPENIQCGNSIFSAEIGSIKFPENDYDSYPNGFSCQWLIQVDDVPHIMAVITSFNFADNLDTLTIYDGATTSAPILGYYTGSTAIVSEDFFYVYDNYYNRNELMVQSTGTSLLIVFESGACFRGFGFTLNYYSSHEASFCDNEFEQILTLQSGLVTERQKGGYRDNSNCFYYITPPSSSYILIDFLQFDVADGDYIEFIDYSGVSSIVIARFYGSDSTYSIQSLSNTLAVHFVSDNYLYDYGFVLQYTGINTPLYCIPSLRLSDSNGIIRSQDESLSNYLPNASCQWNINVDAQLYDSIYIYFEQESFGLSYASDLTVSVSELASSTIRSVHTVDKSIPVLNANNAYVSHSSHLNVSFEANGFTSTGFVGEYCAHQKHQTCEHEYYSTLTASFDNHFCGLYYAANSYCEWTFNPHDNSENDQLDINYIMITFPLVDLRNNDVNDPTDFIDIQTGSRSSGPFLPLKRLAGSKSSYQSKPPTFVTDKQAFHVVFQSDDNLFGEGFNATTCTSYVGNPNECNGINLIDSTQGSFNNYFCGKIHGADASCTWSVEEKNEPITSVMFVLSNLQFSNEETQQNSQSLSDQVSIYKDGSLTYLYNFNGARSNQARNLDSITGNPLKNPEVVSLESSDVAIQFTSNAVGFTEGFEGTYCLFTENDERLCSATNRNYHELSGQLNNHVCDSYYQANALCDFTIRPNFESNSMDIILYITYADFGEGDSINIYNSTTDPSNIVATYSKHANQYVFPKSFIGERDQFVISFVSDQIDFGKGFDAEYCSVAKPASTCGGGSVFTNNYGIVRDHSCGPTYYAPMDCSWTISPSVQNFTYIAIIFNELELGQGARVEIYDPVEDKLYTSDSYLDNDEDGSRIIKGSAIFIANPSVTIAFVVDNNAPVLKSGWEIEYQTIQETGICSGLESISESQGYIQDHVYGNFYQNNQQCTFLIQIPSARAITAKFEYFNLESGYDFLEIYDGSSFSSELIGFLSGSDIPEPFTTSSNSLYLTFTSDYSIVRPGFKLFYSDADLLDCPLFCSGHGECIDNQCVCDSDRFGEGCEIFPAPKATIARFSNSLDSISITFERVTNRANMFGSLSTNCSILLAPNTMNKLGFNPRCLWKDDKTFIIRVGNEATILPNDRIDINGQLIQDPNPTDLHPYGEETILTLENAVEPAIPISVVIGPTIIQTNRDLTLDGSASYITGGRKPLFNWSVEKVCLQNQEGEGEGEGEPGDMDCSLLQQRLQGYVELQKNDQLVIGRSYFNDYPSNAVFYFRLSVQNFLGVPSKSVEHIVHAAPTAVPMVIIAGPETYNIKRNEPLFIRSYVEVSDQEFTRITDSDACPSVTWRWELVCLSDHCKDEIIPLPEQVKTIADIYIPGDILTFNTTYKLGLDISYIDPDTGHTLRSNEYVFINVDAFEVDIIVDGGIQILSLSDEIHLNARLVKEQQEQLNGSITYRWACRKSSGYLCQKLNSDQYLSLEESSSIIIPPESLPPGDYIFYVIGTFEDENFISKDRESVNVRILRSDQPIVRILRDGAGKHDPRKPLILTGELEDNSITSYQWSVSAGDLQLKAFDNIWSESTQNKEIVIAPNTLQDGATYRFKFTVNRASDGASNFAEIEIQVNESPAAGRLFVTPSFGYSLDTKFSFSVTGASDDVADMPLKYVFSVIPVSCPDTKLPDGKCPLIPISNSVEYPRFKALLPAGEYYPAVDVFDRIGSFTRVIAPFTIEAYDTCPVVANRLISYMNNIAVLARAYDCLSDSDTVRQLVNIASVSLTCVEFEIPDEALEIYFNELQPILNQVDEKQQSTEVYVDNQVKSFLLSSTLPLFNRFSDLSDLLSNSVLISSAAEGNGFLRDDSASSLLSALSNLIPQDIAANDIANVLTSLNSIGGGQLRDRTCNNIASDVSSTNIRMRNQRQSADSFANSRISTNENSSTSSAFTFPSSTGLSGCVNYVVVDFDQPYDQSENVVSLPATLTLTDENNESIQLSSSSDPIQIRIPITGDLIDNAIYVCSSWSEEQAQWVEDCTFVGIEDGYYIMESTHLTSFSVLLGGVSGGGGGNPPSISTFGSFDTYFTAATEIFGPDNLDEDGNLVSSFTALSDIPTEAFATSNEVYDILQYSYDSDAENEWTVDRILTLIFTGAALICIVLAIMVLSIPAVRNRLSGKADRTKRNKVRAETRRKKEMESLHGNSDSSFA